jgi:hypothetical protein
MSHLATDWSRLRAWSASHGPELRLCVRSTTAALLTLAAAQVLHLPIALWAVLTAVILTQISVGRSLKATIDYLASTLGGAVYAGAIGALVPHDNELAVFVALAIALAPAVLLAALNPRFSAAPFTAVMVFFGPTITLRARSPRPSSASSKSRSDAWSASWSRSCCCRRARTTWRSRPRLRCLSSWLGLCPSCSSGLPET